MTKIKKQTTIKFMPPAPQGKAGPSYYPAGVWNVNAVYKYTDKSVPVVVHMGLSYALQDNETTRKGLQGGLEPNQDTNKVNWEYLEKQKYVFTDVAFIEFGKLGSSVFNGDFMFSQHGRDGSGNPIETEGAYKDFTPSNPMGGPFRPNILMNMLTGESWFMDANIEGSLHAGSISYKTKTNGGSMNGFSMALGGNSFVLPTLSKGQNMEIKALFPSGEGAAVQDELGFTVGNNPNAKIVVYNNEKGVAFYEESVLLNSNTLYTIFGYCDNNGFTTWIVGGSYGGSGNAVLNLVADAELSSSSKNPIQNKAVYAKFVEVEQKLGNKIVKVNSAPGSDADPNTLYVITT